MYANSPVLVLSGKIPTPEFEMGSLQEMDQVTLVSSITKWARTRAPSASGSPFVGIIGNDGAWGQIKVAQEMLYGPGKASASELDPETPYHRMVEGLGGFGAKVTRPEDIRPALARRSMPASRPAST
jgi:thiamine pyrophosphate-dependent acetolactate synthase large subunit-like protein